MARVPLQQFLALTRKEWIVLWRHWPINLLRCLIVPVGYAVFLGYAKELLGTSNDLGLGQPTPIRPLSEALGSSPLYYLINETTPSAASFDGRAVVDALRSTLSTEQQGQLIEYTSDAELGFACPQSFAGRSDCFAAFSVDAITLQDSRPAVNYTLRFNGAGLTVVRAPDNDGDYERTGLPLQNALDRAIMQVSLGLSDAQLADIPVPLEQPFSRQTNAEEDEDKRLQFLSGMPSFLVLAFGILFLGVPYHLPASVSSERSGGMTDLLTSAGCSQAARLASWMAAEGVAYLPAYLIGAGVHATTLFTRTSAAAVLAFYVLPALALAAWSLFLSTFFRSSALSGIVVTGIAILGLIVGLLTNDSGDGAAVPIAFVLPSSSITYSFTIASRFETAGRATNLVQRAPSDGSGSETIGGTLIAQYAINLVAIIVFPLLAAAVERRLFYRSASRADKRAAAARAEEGEKERPALEITNLVKRYGRKKKGVLAVDDLSFEVPQGGLTALLGSNGSGKSTTMACVTGLEAFSSGSILVDGWPRDMMPPGTVGFAPQRNVNWSELNALQHVQVFHAIKHRSGKRSSRAKHEALLEHVELAHKMKTRPGAMSGGMRRKLQLAMALVGDSSLLLVDEATTGLDPLARRSIWKILLAQRGTRTILFTTHAIDDEVDVLSDDVIILGAPGKQLARGSPVRLKQTLGAEDGTLVHVVLRDAAQAAAVESAVAAAVGEDVATRRIAAPSVEEVSLRLSTQDTAAVQRALDAVEKDKEQLGVLHYDVHGPSLENVFLRLRAAHEQAAGREVEVLDEKIDAQDSLNLHEGKQRGWFKLTIAQWLKRAVIFRRSWFAPLGAIAVAILGSLIPTYIFLDDRNPSCGGPRAQRNVRRSLFLEPSAGSILGLTTPPQDILLAPPGPLDTILGASYPLQASSLTQISAAEYNQTFSSFDTARDIGFGGALLVEGQTPQFAYQAQPDFLALQAPASALANLVANAQAFQASENAPIIFPFSLRISSSFAGTGLGDALKWAVVYGLAQAVWPAFATLYPTSERASGAKAMTKTNGMRALPFWSGHLLWELPIVLIATVPVAAAFGSLESTSGASPFAGVGLLWVCLALYGIAGTLQAFVFSLLAPNALAAFALCAAWSVIAFLIYFAASLLTLTYYVGGNVLAALDVVFYITALLSPAVAASQAGQVSINLYSRLCNGRGGDSDLPMRAITHLGAPVLYLVLWSLVLLAVLVWRDGASADVAPLVPFRRKLGRPWRKARKTSVDDESRLHKTGEGVTDEAARVESAASDGDALRVSHLTKRFGKTLAVDDVSFGIEKGTIFALAGSTGGGKSSLLRCIRGEDLCDTGRVTIGGVDLDEQSNAARAKLGSVPQHDGLDLSMTVEEHLRFYARLKGVARADRAADVETLLDLCQLRQYRARKAGALSGGNKRKLSLALSIMGSPACVILDELSSGVDPGTMRALWSVLRRVVHDGQRCVLLCTHSMQELAISQRLAIQASALLLIGDTRALRGAYPGLYELQMDIERGASQEQVDAFVTSCVPEARRSDLGLRYEIDLGAAAAEQASLAELHRRLAVSPEQRAAAGVKGWQLGPITLEGLFIRVVKRNAQKGDGEGDSPAVQNDSPAASTPASDTARSASPA